jgi:hypothetical protein
MLFTPERPELSKIAARSIIDQQTTDALKERAESALGKAASGMETLVAVQLGSSFVADVALVRPDAKEAVAIFEWKVGAHFQVTGADTYNGTRALDD